MTPFEIWDERNNPKNWNDGLPYGEEITIVGRTMWTQCTSVTDGQNYETVQHIASHGNKKLSYCWETVRRESMPRIAEMDVEMTT